MAPYQGRVMDPYCYQILEVHFRVMELKVWNKFKFKN